MGRNPDVVVILAWLVACALLGFSRKDFTGDGLRHLPPILESSHPRLGEPRWLLFPAFLYLLLKPFVALGVCTTVEQLTRPMLVATLGAAAVYMFALRSCLRSLGLTAPRRSAALLVASFTAGLFFAATDLMEPIFAAALATVGLAIAARRQPVAEGGTVDDRNRALLTGVAIIALASFIYQGVVLTVGLLPIFSDRRAINRRTVLVAAVLLAAVPVLTTATLVLAGNTVGHAFERFSQGEENPLYRSYLKKTGFSAYAVALVAGPPQGVIALPGFRGFNQVVAGIRTGSGRRDALVAAFRLAVGFCVLAGFVVAAARRRHFTIIVALGALVVLPMVRHQQYGYLKYYVMLPVIVAVAAGEAPGRLMVGLAALLAILNGTTLIERIKSGRDLYAARAPIYATASQTDCWLTTGWGPAVGIRWPGSVCAMLGKLSGGSGNDVTQVIAASRADLTACLKSCFCESSGVYTDDVTTDGLASLSDNAQHFHYDAVDLSALVVPVDRARLLSSTGAAGDPVYQYSQPDQARLCSLISSARR